MIAMPDVNVLVYAMDETSTFHRQCNDWLNAALNGESPLGFTWHSLAGFIRIVTNPRIVSKPLSVTDAFDSLQSWLDQPASHIIHPSATHLATYRKLVETLGRGGNLTTDANLAAIAIGHDAELVSCDNDFARFPGLKWFNLAKGTRIKN